MPHQAWRCAIGDIADELLAHGRLDCCDIVVAITATGAFGPDRPEAVAATLRVYCALR